MTQKITRKLASESSDHKDVMNYYSTISRDETGAPVKWKMNSAHEEIVPGRGSPALAKISRSRSNSRDSSSERKKQESENSQSKLSISGKKGPAKQSQENVTSVEPEVSEKDSSVVDNDTSNATIVSEKKKSENSNNSIELEKKVRKKGRHKSKPFTHIKKLKHPTVKNVVLNDEVDKSEVTVRTIKKKRGRPKSLDLMNSESMETVMNGEDDYFKSPHPLTPCNIHVKPKKGRPKETPPTLEPEPSVSPNTLTIEDAASAYPTQSEHREFKKKAGPGRPAKKRKISGEVSQVSDAVSEKLDNEKDKKNKVPKNKLPVKTKMIGKRKHIVPLKAKTMIFKGKSNLGVKKSVKNQAVEIQVKRKGGRPPGSKNRPKPVEHLIKEAKLRRNSKDSENSLDMKEAIEPSTNKTESVNEHVVSNNPLTEKGDAPNNSVSTVSSMEESINNVVRQQKMLSKNVKSKDPLRKGLLSKGKVNPKSKALKAENSVPVVKRKKILASYAKKYTDSSIASLPSNDLRRKLYKRLQKEPSINEIVQKEDIKEKKVDEKEVDISFSELNKQTPHSVKAGHDETSMSEEIDLTKSTSEVKNLSAMVESKRFAKVDMNTPVRKVGRPKKSILELGKASDNESTCSEISSYSAVSYSAMQNDKMCESEPSKVKKKPGRKRKLTPNEESLDKNSDLIGPEKVPKSDIIYDFAADEAATSNMKTAMKIVKRKVGRPKMLKPGNTNNATIKKAFQSTMKQAIRTPMKKDVLKHLTKVKKAKGIKSKLLKPEFKKRKRENEFLITANASDSKKLIDEVKDELNVSGKCVEANSESGNTNGYAEDKLSMPKHSWEIVGEQALGKDSFNVDYDKVDMKFDDTEKWTNKDEKQIVFKQVPKDIGIPLVQTDNNEKSQQEATSAIDNNIDLSNNLGNVVKIRTEEGSLAMNANNDKQNLKVNDKEILLQSSCSKVSQNSEETEESDNEKPSFQFDSKSILDRAKAISFEVTEKKRLLKEKILKGREFSKSFMCNVVETKDEIEEGEPVLPDKEIDIERCSTYSSKTEELSIGIDQEEKFLSDDGTDEINFFEEESTESGEEIVEEILKTIIDKVCKEVTLNSAFNTMKTDASKGNSLIGSLSNSADEMNIREFLGNIPDSVQSMKTFNVGKDDSKNVTFKAKKRVSKVEPVKWQRKVRKREKKSTKETEVPVVRKIELRQKISRSPLDNIALRQSIEENEYLREQMKKTKRGPKPKLKLSPTVEPGTLVGTSELLEQSNDLKQSSEATEKLDVNTNTEIDLDESSPVPAITINDLQKECKPCSVILKDFLKELQMKSTMEEKLDESQESSLISEEEETEENQLTTENNVKPLEKEKSENCGAVESGNEADSEINEDNQRKEAEKNPGLISENKEVMSLSQENNTPQKDQLIALETKEQKIVSKDITNEQSGKPVTESKLVTESTVTESRPITECKLVTESENVMESMDKEVVQKRRGRRTVKGIRNASGLNLPRRSLRPREASPKANSEANKDDTIKDKAKKLTNETAVQKQKYNINSIEPTEQTARKTVPPLKIKLQGGLTSKTKVYKVESAVNSSPSSVDSALDKKPKKKFKSKSKSDSESEKAEKRKSHHHAKKHTKSPEKSEESDSGKHGDKKKIDSPKTDTLKAQDAYEANFLAFIQKQEKEDSVNMANWRNPVVSKTSHQLVGGKACKSGDDGSLTVSACALAETKTSSVGSDKSVTLSKSSSVSSSENNVLTSTMDECKKNVTDETINDKKSELEHFQQTEKVVNSLVSKLPSNKQYICNHCEFLCETQNEIVEHTKSLHKDQLLYSCTICHKVTFKTKPGIMAHFTTYHQGMKDSYICLPDYFEKQIEPKPVKSPTDQSDNIFDRMSNLFDMQSSKADSSKTVTHTQTESVVPSKTAAEADSTTKLDEGEDQLSIKAISVDDDSGEEVTAAKKTDNQDVEDTPTSVKTRLVFVTSCIMLTCLCNVDSLNPTFIQ